MILSEHRTRAEAIEAAIEDTSDGGEIVLHEPECQDCTCRPRLIRVGPTLEPLGFHQR